MLCRTARVSKGVAYRPLRCQRQAYFLRSNSTSTSQNEVNASSPDNTPQETTAEKQSSTGPTHFGYQFPSNRTAHLRFWEPVHSIADVWVVKRAMEKKYGTILETYFFKVRKAHIFSSLVPECIQRISKRRTGTKCLPSLYSATYKP
jgi:hypothetical protein